MSEEFKTAMEYLKSLHDQYFEAICAFHSYEALRKLRAPNVVGEEEAEKNARSMSRYNYFFGPAERALFQISLLELAKIFDESNQALHINKIVNYVASNRKKLSRDDFKEFNQGRVYLDGLYEQYEGISTEDLQSVETDLKAHEVTLTKLKNYRDQYLAHNDKHKEEIKITFDEVGALFKLAEKILNLFSAKLNDSTTMYDHIEDYTMRDAKYLFIALDRSETYRLKEIHEKYQKQRDSQ